MRIVAINDNCVDVYTNLNRVFPGGGSVNFAVHAARLGAQACYAGTFGDDEMGRLMQQALSAEGIDLGQLRFIPGGKTAVAYVHVDEQGDRNFLGSDPGVRYQFTADQPLWEYLQGADLIHVTLDSRMEAEVPRWKAAGLKVSFDYSHRPTPEQIALLPHIDLAFFSGQKLSLAEAEEAALRYKAAGAGLVVVTLGERGSMVFDGTTLYRQYARPITPVDTLGAGDAYMSAFAVTYLRTGDIPAAMLAGTANATAVCGHYGGWGHGIPYTPPETHTN